MKTVSFIVPCSNLALNVERCIESLLPAIDDAEIILIYDRSTDGIRAICERYAAAYPHAIQIYFNGDGGYGAGINQGLKLAQGIYIKIIASEDWLNVDALQQVMKTLHDSMVSGSPIDLLITNYIHMDSHSNESRVTQYRATYPVNQLFHWKDIHNFWPSQQLLIYSVFYRIKILRQSRLLLPKNTLYTSNLFVYQPLPFVQTLYYLDVDLYHFNANGNDMETCIDQQIYMTKIMLSSTDLFALKKVNPKLAKQMYRYLTMMVTSCSMLLLLGGTKSDIQKRKALCQYIKAYDSSLYRRQRYCSPLFLTMIPGRMGRAIGIGFYRLAQGVFHLAPRVQVEK